MLEAVIFHLQENVMQSAPCLPNSWVVQISSDEPKRTDPVMGWNSTTNTYSQKDKSFASLDEAIAYCDNLGIDYIVDSASKRKHKHVIKSYASLLMMDPNL